jgi:hypothetical protein
MTVRMLSSPVRMCFVTSRYLPNGKSDALSFAVIYLTPSFQDFLIRLAPKRVASPLLARSTQYLLPDGLEHQKIKGRRSGRAVYIICWKRALQQLAEQGVNHFVIIVAALKLAGLFFQVPINDFL